MKFLVTMQFNRGSADNVSSLLEAGQAFMKSTQDAGNLDCAYATLDHPAKVVAIMSADSNEAALKAVSANPLAPLATISVEPLADVQAVFEGNAARS